MKDSTMNHTSSTTSAMHAFNALWQWLMAKPGQPASDLASLATTPRQATPPDWAGGLAQCQQLGVLSYTPTITQRSRPVRVLQVMDAGPSHGGRLRISGRMADVCAELDRLAAREALQH